MAANPPQSRPWGFGVFTRIVYVHQAVCLAFFVAGLRLHPSQGIDELVLPHLMGIAISLAVLVAMFVVASKKSLRALSWLRVILWIGVVKILIVQLWLIAHGEIGLASYAPCWSMSLSRFLWLFTGRGLPTPAIWLPSGTRLVLLRID
jgi:hypothetical protein